MTEISLKKYLYRRKLISSLFIFVLSTESEINLDMAVALTIIFILKNKQELFGFTGEYDIEDNYWDIFYQFNKNKRIRFQQYLKILSNFSLIQLETELNRIIADLKDDPTQGINEIINLHQFASRNRNEHIPFQLQNIKQAFDTELVKPQVIKYPTNKFVSLLDINSDLQSNYLLEFNSFNTIDLLIITNKKNRPTRYQINLILNSILKNFDNYGQENNFSTTITTVNVNYLILPFLKSLVTENKLDDEIEIFHSTCNFKKVKKYNASVNSGINPSKNGLISSLITTFTNFNSKKYYHVDPNYNEFVTPSNIPDLTEKNKIVK